MEITAFLLGVLSVVFLVGTVLGAFSVWKISKLNSDVSDIHKEIENVYRNTSQISENDIRMIHDFSRDVNDRFDNLYRDLDSRFDKLENRLKAETKGKQILKD